MQVPVDVEGMPKSPRDETYIWEGIREVKLTTDPEELQAVTRLYFVQKYSLCSRIFAGCSEAQEHHLEVNQIPSLHQFLQTRGIRISGPLFLSIARYVTTKKAHQFYHLEAGQKP